MEGDGRWVGVQAEFPDLVTADTGPPVKFASRINT